MPVFEKHTVFKVARNVEAFLNLEAGVLRLGAASGPPRTSTKARIVEAVKSRDVKALLSLEAGLTRPGTSPTLRQGRGAVQQAGPGADGSGRGINPENIVWIFGSGRSGSTWLSSMMGEMSGQVLWGEPWVGGLFGNFYYEKDESRRRNPQFIMGRHRESWIGSIRSFLLNAAAATFPTLGPDDYLIIKEPNGSIGAPLMMEALPESRLVLLTRDPRDVVASSQDARREGGWHHERNKNRQRKEPPKKGSVSFAEGRAKGYLQGMGNAKKAYDAHAGRKTLIKYEELNADALNTMRRLYREIELPVDDAELARIVHKHSWENIPEEERGEGKFYRKATPGGWREDLTPEQARTVERITAPLLKELYPEMVG